MQELGGSGVWVKGRRRRRRRRRGGGGDTHWVTECIYIVLQATYMHP